MLEDLRDIHLPQAISWWPPAPGWWVLLLLLLSIPVIVWWLRRRSKRTGTADTIAFAEIAVLREVFVADQDMQQLLSGLSALLRRVAMAMTSRREVAALTGDTWIAWLDEQVNQPLFAEGVGKLIADAHYRPRTLNADVDGDAVLNTCEQWLTLVFQKHLEPKQST